MMMTNHSRVVLLEEVAVDAAVSTGELTEREQEILAFERQWWTYAGAKEQAIKDLFDLSAVSYTHLTLPTKRIV